MRKQLTIKISALVIPGILFATLLATFLTYTLLHKDANDMLMKFSSDSVKAISSEIEQQRKSLTELSIDLSQNQIIQEQVKDKRFNNVKIELDSISLNKPNVFFYITDANGAVLFSTIDGYKETNISGVSTVANALSGQTTNDIVSTSDFSLGVIASAPIQTEGALVGTINIVYRLDTTYLVDYLKSVNNTEFTIFSGDTRISTTIEQNGKRVVGTKLSPDILKQLKSEKKQIILETDVLGMAHSSAYEPVFSDDGSIKYILYSGINIESLIKNERTSLRFITIGSIFVILIINSLIVLAITYIVKRPLKKVTQLAEDISSGNLRLNGESYSLNIKTEDEIGQLAKALENTGDTLKDTISDIANVVEAISNGDFTKEPQADYFGDFLSIREALTKINSSLSVSFGNIVESANQISIGAVQVEAGSQMLSQGSTEQAASIQELSATLNELDTRIKKNAESADLATKITIHTTKSVYNSNEQMKNLISNMKKIEDSSKKIGEVVKTINDIAFQTNILALNASVEAARAGAAGKGFAVVADEVRSLATKSAKAVEETTALIKNTINSINDGVKSADETALSLVEIVKDSKEVTRAIYDINSETSSQAEAISQISLGLEQISSVVQSNTATAEEEAASSEELSSQVSIMLDTVRKFKISGTKDDFNTYEDELVIDLDYVPESFNYSSDDKY